MLRWHRLFGSGLKERFENTVWEVELEKELSLKQQYLDIVIIRKKAGKSSVQLPDGLDLHHPYSLITYKSLHESLDGWAIQELVGHYVNFRKQLATAETPLPSENQFGLYGLSTRYPDGLFSKMPFQKIQSGVYDIMWGNQRLRIVVLSQIPTAPHNAIWNLFSAKQDVVSYGFKEFWAKAEHIPEIFNELAELYELEGVQMSYTVEDFINDVHRRTAARMTVEERLAGLSTKQRLIGLSAEQRLTGLSAEEVIGRYPPEKRLEGLSPEEIKAYLKKLES